MAKKYTPTNMIHEHDFVRKSKMDTTSFLQMYHEHLGTIYNNVESYFSISANMPITMF